MNDEHVWVRRSFTKTLMSWEFCMTCGVVKRRDGQNKPCKGPTRLRKVEGEEADPKSVGASQAGERRP